MPNEETNEVLIDSGIIPLGNSTGSQVPQYTANLKEMLEAVFATEEGAELRKKRLANDIERKPYQLEIIRIWNTLPQSKNTTSEPVT